jgi:ferredoxin-NADP reductase
MTDAAAGTLPASHWQNAKIVEIIPRTPTIKSFIFALSEPFAYRAGQHVDVRLTAPDGYKAMRSYSIASAPSASARIELAIELLENGEVSLFFHETAVVGDEIEVRGPLGGHFVWTKDDGGPLLMVAGGSGVVPLMSMIRYRHAAASAVPTLLLLSARSWVDVLYRDELFDLSAQGTGLDVVLTLTREAPRRPKDYGRRVDSLMMTDVLARLPVAPRHVFICGANAFVNAAADGALEAGVPASVVRTERYGA